MHGWEKKDAKLYASHTTSTACIHNHANTHTHTRAVRFGCPPPSPGCANQASFLPVGDPVHDLLGGIERGLVERDPHGYEEGVEDDQQHDPKVPQAPLEDHTTTQARMRQARKV